MFKDIFAAIGLGGCIGYFGVILAFEFAKGVEFFKEKWKNRKNQNVEETR